MSWDTKIKKEITLKMFISIRVCWHSNLFLSSSVWGFPFTVFCRLFLFTVLLPCWCTVCHWLCLIMKIIYCISGFPSMCYMTWSVRTTNKFVYCSSFWLCFPLERCGSGAPPPAGLCLSLCLFKCRRKCVSCIDGRWESLGHGSLLLCWISTCISCRLYQRPTSSWWVFFFF